MKSIAIEGSVRENVGKKSSKKTRKDGNIPCNLYGGGESISFSAPSKSFKALIYTPDFHSAEIKLGDKTINCIVKEVQFDPISDAVRHIDFLQLVPGKTIIVDLPVSLVGTPVGIKTGGKLIQRLKKLKVKTTPEKLTEKINIDVAGLEFGKSIRVDELSFDGMEILDPAHMPVASVMIPRLMKEEVAAAPTAAAATTDTATPAAGAAAPTAGAAAPAAKAEEKKK